MLMEAYPDFFQICCLLGWEGVQGCRGETALAGDAFAQPNGKRVFTDGGGSRPAIAALKGVPRSLAENTP